MLILNLFGAALVTFVSPWVICLPLLKSTRRPALWMLIGFALLAFGVWLIRL